MYENLLMIAKNFDIETFLFIVLIFVLGVQLFYYIFFYLRLSRKKKHFSDTFPPVSVIVCARNEEENLKKFLPSVLNQNYPDYEVIVVNDASEDNSDVVLKNFSQKYKHLKISTIKKDEKFTHNKKLALTIGIKAASNEILLLTDADCYPIDNYWISSMVSSYKPESEIVLGYGGYEKQKGLLNKLIRFDTLFIAMQYFTFAMAGIPYMGVGRNLSYKKTLFFKNKGFASHSHLRSGDDDLFVNKTANKYNVSINLDVHTLSVPEKKFSSWIMQKKRHQSTFHRYKLKHKILLLLEPISRWLFYSLTIILFILKPALTIWLIGGLLLKWLFLFLVFYFSTKTLKEKDLLLFSPVFDIVNLAIDLIVKLYNSFYKIKAWK